MTLARQTKHVPKAANSLVRVGSIAEIAGRLGVSESAVECWRRGRFLPSPALRGAIAEAYKIPLGDWLVREPREKGHAGYRNVLPPGVTVSPTADGRGWRVTIPTERGPVEYVSRAASRGEAEAGAIRVARDRGDRGMPPTPSEPILFERTYGRTRLPDGFGFSNPGRYS